MAQDTHKTARQIVGFSLSPERAEEIRAEAKARGLSLRQLMEELWELYRKKHPAA